MYRKAFESLTNWNISSKRKPLILMGARQVGKTWLMNALFTNFRGSLTEQYVLQEIVASGRTPYYWTSDSGNAEIEFVVQGETNVFPVEAKAGINTKAKSLKVYRDLFAPPHAIRTSLAPHADGTATKDIPLYAFGSQLPNLLTA